MVHSKFLRASHFLYHSIVILILILTCYLIIYFFKVQVRLVMVLITLRLNMEVACGNGLIIHYPCVGKVLHVHLVHFAWGVLCNAF